MKMFQNYTFFILGLSISYTKTLIYAGEGGKAIDHVCTMQIDKASSEALTKDGYTYYFCSGHCKAAFVKNPEKYSCICTKLHKGCNCEHCEGEGLPCRCAEASTGSHNGEHKHEHEGHSH